MNKIADFTKGIIAGGKVADDLHHSGEEVSAELSARHAVDMKSDNILSKTIRPLTLLILLGLQCLIILLSAFLTGSNGMGPIPVEIVIQHGVLLTAAFSFYFSSKKAERVAEKNATANLEIATLNAKMDEKRMKHELREDRRESRAERRAARKEK